LALRQNAGNKKEWIIMLRFIGNSLLNVNLYIDPATTSYLIQIIAGVVIAAGAMFGICFSKIKRIFKKDKTTTVKKKKDDGDKKTVTADDLLDDEE